MPANDEELLHCPDCHGRGERWVDCSCVTFDWGWRLGGVTPGLVVCPTCGGYDESCYRCRGSGSIPCEKCGGQRRIVQTCDTCSATGYLSKSKVVALVEARCAQKELEEEARKKREAEAEERRKIEEEARREREVEEAARRKAAEEAASREREAKEAARKKAAEEAEKQRRVKEARQRHIRDLQERRRSAKSCIMCGKPLGFFDKLARREKHEHCTNFTE